MSRLPLPTLNYDLEQLLVDQDHDLVVDTIAPVLAWVPRGVSQNERMPFGFRVETSNANCATTNVGIGLSWVEDALEARIPGVRAHANRLRRGKSVQREHVTELAAYGLAFVAISVLLPGRRVKAMRMGSAPDMLFDVTPNALRGVETAGRSTGGRAALKAVRREKRPQLLARTDVVEVHLSLWCASPRVSIMERVEP